MSFSLVEEESFASVEAAIVIGCDKRGLTGPSKERYDVRGAAATSHQVPRLELDGKLEPSREGGEMLWVLEVL